MLLGDGTDVGPAAEADRHGRAWWTRIDWLQCERLGARLDDRCGRERVVPTCNCLRRPSVNGTYFGDGPRDRRRGQRQSRRARSFALTIRADPGDDFGNSQTDISVFRTSDAYLLHPEADHRRPSSCKQFGGAGRRADQRRFLRQRAQRYRDLPAEQLDLLTPSTRSPEAFGIGSNSVSPVGSVPVPGDYDGDGQTDFAVFVPEHQRRSWSRCRPRTRPTPTSSDGFGGHPRPGRLLWQRSRRPRRSTGRATRPFTSYDQVTGSVQDRHRRPADGSTPVPADYEGLGHVDPAVYEPGATTYRHPDVGDEHDLQPPVRTRRATSPSPAITSPTAGPTWRSIKPSSATFLALDIPTNALPGSSPGARRT